MAKLTAREWLAETGKDAEEGTLRLRARADVEEAEKTKRHLVSLSDEDMSSDDQAETAQQRRSNSRAGSSRDITTKVQEQMSSLKISDREGKEDFVGAAACARQDAFMKRCGLCSYRHWKTSHFGYIRTKRPGEGPDEITTRHMRAKTRDGTGTYNWYTPQHNELKLIQEEVEGKA